MPRGKGKKPALSGAERMQRYREKKREENEEEFLEKNKEQVKKTR